MGLFDDLKKAKNAVGRVGNVANGIAGAVKKASNKTETVTFPSLPETLEAFKSLPQAALSTPFDTAALTVIALCFYPKEGELSYAMLDFLKGPNPLTPREKQFIRDRFMEQNFIPRSYFTGATPENDYTPSEPYTVKISENPYSYDNQGYAKLFIACGGADTPRPITLRQAKDGRWYLWEQFLLSGIREPESADPWA